MKLRLFVLFLVAGILGNAISAGAQPEAIEKELLTKLSLAREDTSRVRLLLKIAAFYQNNPSFIKTRSPFSYATDAEALTQKLAFKQGLGETYRTMAKIKFLHERDTAAAVGYTKKAIEIFRANNLSSLLGETFYDMSLYYDIRPNNLTERIQWTESAYAAFQQDHDIRRMADCNRQLGDLLCLAGRYIQGMDVLKKALKQYQSIGEKRLHWVYDLMGSAYYALGEYPEAQKYGEMAVAITEDLKEFNGQTATVYNRMGITYQALKAYSKAKASYDKAMALATAAHYVDAMYIVAGNTAHLMIDMGEQQQAATYLHDIMKRYTFPNKESELVVDGHLLRIAVDLQDAPRARELNQKLIRMLQQDEQISWSGQRRGYYSVIHYYHSKRDYTTEKQYLLKYIKISQTSRAFRDLAVAHLWAFRADSALGNFQSAVKHYQRHDALNDSLFSIIKESQVKDLEVLFEKQEKENDLLSKERDIVMLKKKAELKSLDMQRATVIRRVVISAWVLFIIVIGLLIYYSRNKQKGMRSLQHRQHKIEKQNIALQRLLKDKEWLVKEIHHRVKNNFHMIMGLLDSQTRFLTGDESSGITKSQQRIHAISLLHINLYQSGSLTKINLALYVHELIQHLKNCYDVPNAITFESTIEPLQLDISFAQPLGLIINEAVTNSIRHAFRDGRTGRIIITVTEYELNTIYLEISDNGMGLPHAFNVHRMDTMGYALIRKCCQEIGATLEVDTTGGTRIKITARIKTDREMTPSAPVHGEA